MLETLLAFVAVHPEVTLLVAFFVDIGATIEFLLYMAIVIWIVS